MFIISEREREKPDVHNFPAHNSGAGNGCANFMGAWHFWAFSAGKPPSAQKIPRFMGAKFVFIGVGIFPIIGIWRQWIAHTTALLLQYDFLFHNVDDSINLIWSYPHYIPACSCFGETLKVSLLRVVLTNACVLACRFLCQFPSHPTVPSPSPLSLFLRR